MPKKRTAIEHGLLLFSAFVVFGLGFLSGARFWAVKILGGSENAVKCLKEYAPVLQVIASLFGIVLIIFQIRRVAKNAGLQHDWNIRKATLDVLNSNHSAIKNEYKKVKEARMNIDPTCTKPYNESDYKDDKEFVHHLRHVLNHFESIAAGIKHGVYDEQIAYDSVRSVFCKMFDFAEPFIVGDRKKSSNPKAAEMFESLVKKWRDREIPPVPARERIRF